MKLSINKEFAVRHLGVAALMAALCAWFIYDGAVTYPAMSDVDFNEKILHRHSEESVLADDFAQKRRNATNRQFQFAGIAGIASLVIAFGVLRVKRQALEWDDASMTGSLTCGKSLLFSDVDGIDKSRWEKKGILVVRFKSGASVTLDAWHHVGVKELAAKLGVA